MTGPDGTAVDRLFDEVWNGGNLDALDRVFALDVLVHAGPNAQSHGRAVFREVIGEWLTAFPDIGHQIDALVATPAATVVRWHGSGTHQGEFQGIAPTGRAMSYWGMTWCRIEEGLIAEAWVSANVDEMMASLAGTV